MSEPDIPSTAIADAVGEPMGPDVLDGAADVDRVPVPGAPSAVIWRIRDNHLDHPQQAYVGQWPDGRMQVLNDDQPAWMQLMSAAGVRIDDAATALAYVRQFLEVTRGPMVNVRPIERLSDVPWRPGSEEEEGRREQFLQAPFEVPVAEPMGEMFQVGLTLVVDQRIQRNSFQVHRDGRLSATFQVLAEDLPLPIIR